MAEVLITFKVMPEEAGMDMDKLSDEIRNLDGVRVNSLKKIPIAFGLVAIESSFVTEDEEGATKTLEDKLKEIDGIREAEVIEVTLV